MAGRRLTAGLVGVACAAGGVWFALAAPEPGRVPPATPPAEPASPAPPPAPVPGPAPAADPTPAPEPPDPGAESFEPPTEEQIAATTSSDYWYWVIHCRENGSRRAMRTLVELTVRFKDEKYHEQVWTAIFMQLTDAEDELKAVGGDSTPGISEINRRITGSVADLEFLSEAIHRALGEARYKEQIAEHRRLDPPRREMLNWAMGRFVTALHAWRSAEDVPAALARLRAAWPMVDQLGADRQRAHCLALESVLLAASGEPELAQDRLGRSKLLVPVDDDEVLRELRPKALELLRAK